MSGSTPVGNLTRSLRRNPRNSCHRDQLQGLAMIATRATFPVIKPLKRRSHRDHGTLRNASFSNLTGGLAGVRV
jgi:hypothetical protein